MAQLATVYRVMIASPGDAKEERDYVEKAINQWNRINSQEKNTVLLPLRWEYDAPLGYAKDAQEIINRHLVANSDMVIGIFKSWLGRPADDGIQYSVREIMDHIECGKPASVHFVQPSEEKKNTEEYRQLLEFKADLHKRLDCDPLFGEYESTTEFTSEIFFRVEQSVLGYLLGKAAFPIQQINHAVNTAQPHSDSDKVEEYLAIGKRLLDDEEYSSALPFFDRAIELDPDCAEAYYLRGQLYRNRDDDEYEYEEDFEKAVDNLVTAIRLEPRNARFYEERGDCYRFDLEDKDKALRDYNMAIRLEPRNAELYEKRGDFYRDDLADNDEALRDYSMAIQLQPQNAEFYGKRGELYRDNLNDGYKAIQDYNMAIRFKPSNAEFYYRRGELYCYWLEDDDKAIQDYSMAIQLEPGEWRHYSHRADAYRHIGKKTLAQADEAKAKELRN